MNESKVFFEGEFGKICGVLHKVDETSEIVIIVHGFSSTKETSAIIIAHLLNDIELNALRIDLDNQGESELDFQTGVSVSNYIKQVNTTINYCKNLGYKKISLIGSSFGGLVTLGVALQRDDLKRIFLRCPGAGMYYRYLKKGREKEYEESKKAGYLIHEEKRPFKFSFDIILDLEKYYPLINLAKEIKIPVGIIHGDKDEVVDYKTTVEFSKYLENAQLHIINGAGHNLSVNGDFSESQKILVDFFKE